MSSFTPLQLPHFFCPSSSFQPSRVGAAPSLIPLSTETLFLQSRPLLSFFLRLPLSFLEVFSSLFLSVSNSLHGTPPPHPRALLRSARPTATGVKRDASPAISPFCSFRPAQHRFLFLPGAGKDPGQSGKGTGFLSRHLRLHSLPVRVTVAFLSSLVSPSPEVRM